MKKSKFNQNRCENNFSEKIGKIQISAMLKWALATWIQFFRQTKRLYDASLQFPLDLASLPASSKHL